jgi:hypothetical protein
MSIISRLRDRVRRHLDAQDERALARGWTVTVGPRGCRTYRDPRWDQLAALRAQAVHNDTAAVPAGQR